MTEVPAMRVHGPGGGAAAGLPARQRCLTQGGELHGRTNGLSHQLAKRALSRAAGGHRGEHVFVKLRSRSDGNAEVANSRKADRARFGSGTCVRARGAASDLAGVSGRARSAPQLSVTAQVRPSRTAPATSQVT